MVGILGVIIIILICVNYDLKNENKRLKEKLKNIKMNTSEGIKVLNENINEQKTNLEQTKVVEKEEKNVVKQTIKENIQNKEKSNPVENSIKQKEQKNIIILITGAICIVLSAIVFLVSTWNSIPNILKTVVLSLLTLVFFGGSYVAKTKFKLEKTSQTFFYIAMAYIPICLISISLFKLFGTYLSFYGEGKYIYLMFSSVFVAFIYYISYKNNNSKFLLFGSILSQVFSVIAFSLVLSNNIILIGINLLLYNILFLLLTKKEEYGKLYNIIPIIMTFIAGNSLFDQNYQMPLMLMLLGLNYLILDIKDGKKAYAYIFNIILMIFGIYTVNLISGLLGKDLSHIIVLVYIVLIYAVENVILQKISKGQYSNSLSIVTLSALGILHIECFINVNLLAPYIVSITQIVMLLIIYLKSKTIGKNITAFLIPMYFIITGFNVLADLNCTYHAYIIFTIVSFVLSELLLTKDKLLHLNAFVISHVLMATTYVVCFLINYNDLISNMFFALLLTAIYIYSCFVNKNKIFKYFTYISLYFIWYTLFRILSDEINIVLYIPLINTFIIMILETYFKKLQDQSSKIFLEISKFISFICLYLHMIIYNGDNTISTFLAILFAIIILVDNVKQKNNTLNILPLIYIIPAIFLNNLYIELRIGIILLTLIGISLYSLKEKKISIYTVFSGIYLILTVCSIENKYLNEIFFIFWSISQFITKTKNTEKDLFKFLSYLSILFIYNSIVFDTDLSQYTAISMLGYIVVAILVLRTIAINYIGNKDNQDRIDVLEYITFAFIYIIALIQYTDITDGMLFGVLLVLLLIISYMKKYGALFMTTVFAILVNIFVLTREFWFSVPWWAYLLTVGIGLIGFAIRNEISDKKTEINAVKIIKNIKEKVEK